MAEPDTASGDADDAAGGAPARDVTLGLVVTCYTMERLEDVLRLLDSVVGQTSPVDRVVIVVQQSRELLHALRPVVARLGEGRGTLQFLETAAGVSRARNVGIRELTTDIIAFVDDDSVLCGDWAAATRHFYREHPGAIGTAGAIEPLWDSPAMEWFPRDLYWMLSCTYWEFTAPVRVRNGYGANMSYRREAFLHGRCFSEACGVGAWGSTGWRGVGGEEPELALRVCRATEKPIMFVPDIRVWHRVRRYRLRPKNLLRRAYWDGRLKAALSRRESGERDVLRTEFSLLREIARAQLGRLGGLFSHPGVVLRQTTLVCVVVFMVGLGFLEGKLRRQRLVCAVDGGARKE